MYTSSAYTTDLIRAFHDEEQIVSFLSDAISENTKEALRVEIDKNPLWLMLQHSHFGMYIRNLLREHGFSYHDFVMDEMRIIWFCARR